MNLSQLVKNKLMILNVTTDCKNKTLGWINARYKVFYIQFYNEWKRKLGKCQQFFQKFR